MFFVFFNIKYYSASNLNFGQQIEISKYEINFAILLKHLVLDFLISLQIIIVLLS